MENRKVRLIDANVLKEKLLDEFNQSGAYTPYEYAIGEALNYLNEQPTIDPESLRPHGKWIEREDYNFDTYYDCSVCGESFCLIEGVPEENFYRYCPNCGAVMQGIQNHQDG